MVVMMVRAITLATHQEIGIRKEIAFKVGPAVIPKFASNKFGSLQMARNSFCSTHPASA